MRPQLCLALALWCALSVIPAAWAADRGPNPLTISISKQDCSRLIRHFPDLDVTYQPGVDARGRKVVPADLDPVAADFARRVVPDVLEIPLTINPINYHKNVQGTAVTSGLGKGFELTQSRIGTVKYDFRTNAFTYNDQPMLTDDQRELAEACLRRGAR